MPEVMSDQDSPEVYAVHIVVDDPVELFLYAMFLLVALGVVLALQLWRMEERPDPCTAFPFGR